LKKLFPRRYKYTCKYKFHSLISIFVWIKSLSLCLFRLVITVTNSQYYYIKIIWKKSLYYLATHNNLIISKKIKFYQLTGFLVQLYHLKKNLLVFNNDHLLLYKPNFFLSALFSPYLWDSVLYNPIYFL
jgi:hypothetical protein